MGLMATRLLERSGFNVSCYQEPALALAAIPAALWSPLVAGLVYAGVAVIWLVPDRRIERMIEDHEALQ